jgi:membrane protein DedA with SNARE-associated domain
MPVRWRFLGYTFVGGASWVGTLVGLGWALGRRWRIVELYASFVGLAVLVVLVSGVLWFLWRRWRAHG